MDSSPGFLNGILSLIFNSQYPDAQFRSQQGKSEAYFHRAKAAELYALLSSRFPKSARRSELLSRLIESYAVYGEDESIIQKGTAFIAEFPAAEQRTKVALQVADAYARRKQTPQELAVYNRLLAELAAKAQQVPLGNGQPRSPEYAQVLQRYVARCPAGRVGRPEEFAGLALLLASDAGGYINGQTINLDGGYSVLWDSY